MAKTAAPRVSVTWSKPGRSLARAEGAAIRCVQPGTRHLKLLAVAVTGGTDRLLRFAVRRPGRLVLPDAADWGHSDGLIFNQWNVGHGSRLMRIATAIAAGAVLLLSGLTAWALESSAKTASKLSADALWSKIGDFCGISNWHPAVEKCELSADGKTRTLSLKGGGTIVEALVKMDAAGHSYTYSIVSSPLPVANYTSTIGVAADGAGSVMTWVGKYDAKGASDAEAKKVIDGIYNSGLKSLTAD